MFPKNNNTHAFQEQVREFYKKNKRALMWRDNINPYWIVVSEIMLQQTQVARVAEKFAEFTALFPTFHSLSVASLEQVLRAWQGMGYNRRGKYLREIARLIVDEHAGVVPKDPAVLETFPGIGPATARSIVVYTYNIPEAFIETNVRRVFIHHFFQGAGSVADSDILPIVRETMDQHNPREWFYALMDYGTHLGRTIPNPNRKSKHYAKQSKFDGSDRQIRGAVIRTLLQNGPTDTQNLQTRLGFADDRLYNVLKQLTAEGIVAEDKGVYTIT